MHILIDFFKYINHYFTQKIKKPQVFKCKKSPKEKLSILKLWITLIIKIILVYIYDYKEIKKKRLNILVP